MDQTRGNKQLSLYFVHTLNALLDKYMLARHGYDHIDGTEGTLHNICAVSSPNKEQL